MSKKQTQYQLFLREYDNWLNKAGLMSWYHNVQKWVGNETDARACTTMSHEARLAQIEIDLSDAVSDQEVKDAAL